MPLVYGSGTAVLPLGTPSPAWVEGFQGTALGDARLALGVGLMPSRDGA